MSKNYIGISRDHSGSMSGITKAAQRDYNENIAGIRESAAKNGQDVIVSVLKCGVGRDAKIVQESVNSSITVLKPINTYVADGTATPLFDSVGELIEILEQAPDASSPDVSFLVMAITDGQDNSSRKYSGSSLGRKIQQLQSTDRWSFVFRVPQGYARTLQQLGIPGGNIQEWEQTERGMAISTAATRSGFDSYYSGLSKGVRSTKTFYTNLSEVSPADLKASLVDISKEVQLWLVKNEREGATIREFVEKKSGNPMIKGAAFYQLMKTEDEVQDYKQIAIRDKKSGAIYSGANARPMLGLPNYGMIRLKPQDHGQYDIYVQSTSINRKLPVGSTLLYWPNVPPKKK